MLHLLLVALQITWTGPGYPAGAKKTPPAIVAQPVAGRVPQAQLVLQALDGNAAVPAEWSAQPDNTLAFNDAIAASAATGPGAYVTTMAYRGPAQITAIYNGRRASLQAFVYNTATAACYMGFPNGIRFDDNGIAKPAGLPQESDIFTVGPPNEPHMDAFYGCMGAFVRPNQAYALHFPYGARVLRRSSGIYFGDVRVSDWRNDFTIAPPLQFGDIVIFRLHDGRTAKILVEPPAPDTFGGVYLTGPQRGDFWDYVAYHHIKEPPHAVFGHI